MSFPAGSRLGPYEIVAPLGAGGMGEVYKGRDTRLDRTVAIKILPDAFAGDAQFRERFDREARVISQLTHPNICTLYDVGAERPRPPSGAASSEDTVRFLVLEYLEGETLSQRLERASKSDIPGLPLDEALHIAVQIADALDKAHRAGVVHRDLKPGNVMLTRSGAGSKGPLQAKLLDFGLAKTTASSQPMVGVSIMPTTPQNLTAQGTILGTFRYMAPEQLEGAEADARTDIFAFGLIVYEMVTGRQVFEGKSQAALIAAILEREPASMSTGRHGVPRALEQVVQGCLAKDPEDRWQSARDVLRQLKAVASTAGSDAASASNIGADAGVRSRRSTAMRLASVAAALLAGIAVSSAYWWIRAPSMMEVPAPLHLSLPLESGAVPPSPGIQFEISPDGRWTVYAVVVNGQRKLFLRGLSQPAGRVIDGTDGAESPFFSSDSQWIGFASGNTLKKVPVSGGSPVSICTMSTVTGVTGFVGGSWASNDTILFVPQFNEGIWTVPAAGGEPKRLLSTDENKDRIAYLYPRVLPGAKGTILTLVPNRARTQEELDTAVLEAGATEPRVLIRGGTNARYVSSGHLVYARGRTLLAVAFDLSRLAVTGTPVLVMDGVQRGPLGDPIFALSDNGTLVYEPATAVRAVATLAVVDRGGSVRALTEGTGLLQEFSVSPDGHSVAARVAAQNDDVWTFDLSRGSPLRLTFEPGDEIWPQWTPDGARIAFGTRVGRIFWKPADGTGQREEISRGEFPRWPSSFSPDGKKLAIVEIHPARKRDILMMSLDGARKVEPFLATDADERDPKFSPDGRWIAYASDEGGRDEIYLRPIGAPGGRKRVSSDGGTSPVWSRNGRELFFLKSNKLASVKLDAGGNPIDTDRVVLDAPRLNDLQFQAEQPYYDVIGNGERFVMLLYPHGVSPTHYNLVVNWFEELGQRMR